MSDPDPGWMRRALALTARARTHPNPCVGAVIVRGGVAVGEGWTYAAGRHHAEHVALDRAGSAARGATLYVTLEPCSHWSRRDGSERYPCAQRCIDAGIARVVCALEDPDDQVAGEGFARLRDAGIAVDVGLGAAQAQVAHAAYLKHRTTGLPYVVHKAAMTLDGKIAAPGGDARWVTGPEARAAVHRFRNRADALVVGVGTVLADNPSLTTRLPRGKGHDPLRVIVDSRLRTPPTARVAGPGTLFAVTAASEPGRIAAFEALGAEVEVLPAGADGRVDVSALARRLADRGYLQVLLESGGALASAWWAAGLVDRAWFFVAPKVIGGAAAPTPIDGTGLAFAMADARALGPLRIRRYGADIALEAEVNAAPKP